MKSGVKKYFILSLFSLVLLANIFVVSAVAGHSASEFWINIQGEGDVTLEDATDPVNNLFIGAHDYVASSSKPDPGHSASEIWISTDTDEMTLFRALDEGVNLEKDGFTGYSGGLNFFHFADEIFLVALNKDLQTAINDGDFCTTHATSSCYWGDVWWYDSCGNREDKKKDCGSLGCSGSSCNIAYTYTLSCTGFSARVCGACSTQTCTCTRNPGGDSVALSFCPAVVTRRCYECAWKITYDYGCTLILTSCKKYGFDASSGYGDYGNTCDPPSYTGSPSCGVEPTCRLLTSQTFGISCVYYQV